MSIGPIAKVEKSIATNADDGTFSDAMDCQGNFNLSLSGTWVGTVFLQRSFDGGTTWMDVASYTSNVEDYGKESEAGVKYRFGCKHDGYTSGTVVGRLSR